MLQTSLRRSSASLLLLPRAAFLFQFVAVASAQIARSQPSAARVNSPKASNPQLADRALNRKVEALLARMTLREKIGQLVQDSAGVPAGPGTGRRDYNAMIASGDLGAMVNEGAHTPHSALKRPMPFSASPWNRAGLPNSALYPFVLRFELYPLRIFERFSEQRFDSNRTVHFCVARRRIQSRRGSHRHGSECRIGSWNRSGSTLHSHTRCKCRRTGARSQEVCPSHLATG
jgi:hypothetical protein